MAEGRQQRRSARISALDTWRLSALTRASGAPRGKRGRKPASSVHPAPQRGRKRGRKKKRLRAVVEVVVSSAGPKRADNGDGDEDGGDEEDEEEREDGQQHRHHQQPEDEQEEEEKVTCHNHSLERSVGSPSVPWIPDKKTLELILDILQRKDTHEIFAEPVDPEEVEGYYDIIKEPMDFGTMRAKLQEGMYATLEQFERDVFLISGNAMHFNSSTTIYYRQARAIQELAKKTFHSLKTDPENFVLDHLSKKTKTGKIVNKVSRVSVNSRPHAESRSSDRVSASVLASHTKQRNATPDGASVIANEKHGSLLASLSSGRNQHPSFVAHGSSPLSDRRRDQEDLGSLKDGSKSCFTEEDRRSTYRSWSPSSSGSDSIFLPLYEGPRQLSYVSEGDFGYVESLTRFAADLGPTAKMVAWRKIQRCKLLEAAKAAPLPATHLQLPLEKMASASSASNGHSNVTERGNRDQASTVQSGSFCPAARIGLAVSRAAVGSVVPEPTVQCSSNQLLAPAPELSPPVSQSKLLEIVSRNGNTWVGGNGGADADFRRPVYCHDNGAALTGPAKNLSRATSLGTAEMVQGISCTRNGLWPHHPDSSLPSSFSQFPRQSAVLDMSFVQARLNGLSSGYGQGQGSKPAGPSVEAQVPYSTDACERARNMRSQTKPSSRSISDSQQPDLALQL
ncbi:Bromodomain and PHD finger-containing protein 3 [Nymphaea thermarum]|nr:Bromodomain and PHD finger-containing protein 3 [Nymphaea thermarum]